MPSDIERERRDLAYAAIEKLDHAIEVMMGDTLGRLKRDDTVIFSGSGSWQPAIYITLADLKAIAALRQPTTDTGTAGRDEGAAEMRERAAAGTEIIVKAALWRLAGEGNGVAEECSAGIAAAIRALPLHPETDPASETEGGERG